MPSDQPSGLHSRDSSHSLIRISVYLGEKILDYEIQHVAPTTLALSVIEKARDCDYHAMMIMKHYNAYNSISQMPVVLIRSKKSP